MSAVVFGNQRFSVPPRPGPAGRGTRPTLPVRLGRTSGGLSPSALARLRKTWLRWSLASRAAATRFGSQLRPAAGHRGLRGVAHRLGGGGSVGTARPRRFERRPVCRCGRIGRDRHRSGRPAPPALGHHGGQPAVRVSRQSVHEVWNPGPAPALSVHVYSPPLRTMTFYDHRVESFLAPVRAVRGELAG